MGASKGTDLVGTVRIAIEAEKAAERAKKDSGGMGPEAPCKLPQAL